MLEREKKQRYTVPEAVKILLDDQPKMSSKVPLRVRRNISFVIDTSELNCWQDVKSDMNGVYSNTLRIATWTIDVNENNNVEKIEKKKVCLLHERQFHVYIHSTKNAAGLCRSIFLLKGRDGEIVNSKCLLQYNLLDKTSDEVVFTVSPHGNSKKSTVPFYPTKKSTMNAIKDNLTSKSPADAFMNAVKSAGGIVGAREPGELPRSKRQVYDLNRNMKKTDQVDELLQYSKHREEAIVIEHHDVPEDLWVLGKSHMTNDLSRFCTSELVNHPFSVDPTFNFGQYDVTPFTYKHLFLKSKRTGLAPTFVGPTAIHHSKQKSVYKKIVSAVVNTSPHLSKNAKGFITDGEQALHDSLKEDLKHATGLRCFRHFYQNCKDKLCSLKI